MTKHVTRQEQKIGFCLCTCEACGDQFNLYAGHECDPNHPEHCQKNLIRELEECRADLEFKKITLKGVQEIRDSLAEKLAVATESIDDRIELEQLKAKLAIAVETLRKIEMPDKEPPRADLSDWLNAWRNTTKIIARQALEKIEGQTNER